MKSALGGGLSGAAGKFALVSRRPKPFTISLYLAMVLQVLTLMPIRTVMNYQYRYGTSTMAATRTLYADGGWTRYYQGLVAALIQGPVSRFGDTAANAGILALLQSNSYMKNLPSLIKTIFASLAAAAFRMILTPIDTVKTTMQTDGKAGLVILRSRVCQFSRFCMSNQNWLTCLLQIKTYGVGSLWWGAIATAAATFVGHYPVSTFTSC